MEPMAPGRRRIIIGAIGVANFALHTEERSRREQPTAVDAGGEAPGREIEPCRLREHANSGVPGSTGNEQRIPSIESEAKGRLVADREGKQESRRYRESVRCRRLAWRRE